jgi:hypothetical protein
MRRFAMLAIVLALLPTSAKADRGCLTLSEARYFWPTDYLKYRSERVENKRTGRQCWYSPSAGWKPLSDEPPRREPIRYEAPAERVQTGFDLIAMFFRPATIEPIEEPAKPKKRVAKKEKRTRIAQVRPSVAPRTDAEFRWILCGSDCPNFNEKGDLREFNERKAKELRAIGIDPEPRLR